MEIWKEIPGYEELYRVSSIGRVKNSNDKILYVWESDRGYIKVQLWKNSSRKNYRIHQLVAMAFLNHDLESILEVDHKDDNKLNNHVDNLQLLTRRQNMTKRPMGKSKYVGVQWRPDRKKWRARISINGKRKWLGCFESEIDAHEAYQNKLKEIT